MDLTGTPFLFLPASSYSDVVYFNYVVGSRVGVLLHVSHVFSKFCKISVQ